MEYIVKVAFPTLRTCIHTRMEVSKPENINLVKFWTKHFKMKNKIKKRITFLKCDSDLERKGGGGAGVKGRC